MNNSALVEIFRADNLQEAHLLRGVLEDRGITVVIDNELGQMALGELPMGWTTSPRVLVPADQLAEAQMIRAECELEIEKGRAARAARSANDDACLACGANMVGKKSCPVCGWSFAIRMDPADEEPGAATLATPTEARPMVEQPIVEPTTATDLVTAPSEAVRKAWSKVLALEFAAVLAIGPVEACFGYMIIALTSGSGETPYVVTLLTWIGYSLCTVVPMLYIFVRSEKTWDQWGLVPFSGWDVFTGGVIFVLLICTWVLGGLFIGNWGWEPMELPQNRLNSALEYLLFFVWSVMYSMALELIYRAYFITRLSELRSPTEAVIFSALVFASYQFTNGGLGMSLAIAYGLVLGIWFAIYRRIWPLMIAQTIFTLVMHQH